MAFDLTAVLRLNSTQFTTRMNAAQRQMNGMRSTARTVTKSLGLIAGAAGVVGVAMNSTKKAMDFQAQMSSMKALTGMSNKQLGQMSKLALKAGQDTAWSALDAAKAEEELAKAGMSTSTIMKGGLTSSLNLATAGGMNLTDAATLMSNSMNAFRDDGLTAAKTANILAGAANASAADMQDLKMGLAAVGPVSAGLEMSLKDTSAALALFSNYSLSGSDAGTSFKTMLMNLQPKTKAQRGLMTDLGLLTKQGGNAFFDASGKVKKLSDIAGILHNSLSGLTAQQRSATLETLFGSDAIRAGNILYKAGAGGVKKMYGEMGKVTALQVARQKMNNAKGAVEQFKGALETLQISVLTPLLPVIKNGANALANWVSHIKPSQIKQWGDNVSAAGQKALQFARFIKQHWGGISTTVEAIAAGLVTLKLGLKGVMIVSTVTRLFRAFRAGTLAATAAELGLNATLLANPFAWVVAGIAALVAAGVVLYKNWDKVSVKMRGVWNDIQLGASGMVNGVIGGINWMINLINKLPGVNIPTIGNVHWGKSKKEENGGGIDNAGTVNGAYLHAHGYANGTAGHLGGLALVGDGKGSNAGSELLRLPSGQFGLTPSIPTLMNLPKGTQVISAKDTKNLLGVPAYANGTISNAISTGWNWLKDKFISIKNSAISHVMGTLGSKSGTFSSLPKALISLVGNSLFNHVKNTFGSGSSGSSKNVTGWLVAALNATGTPLSWLPGLQRLVGAESGGNPSAVNRLSVLGQHATGLLQMLPSTFQANMVKGLGNILNPIHNAAAAIRYIKSRYGSVYNTPLFKGGPYKGYSGGLDRVPYDGFTARLHKDERIQTRQEADNDRNGKGGRTFAFTINVNGQLTDQRTIDTLLDAIVTKIQKAGEAGA